MANGALCFMSTQVYVQPADSCLDVEEQSTGIM